VAAGILSPRYLPARRGLLAVGLITLAFHYSLSTLVRTLQDQTPLSYLGLVPLIALGLAAASIRPELAEPTIHDRQVDYIIGLPLIVASIAFDVLMPVRLSTMFWLWRLDLVSLPLFVAGTICVLFGVRTLWRLKIPVLFLLLAWPLPYTTLLVNWLTAFTNSTLAGLDFMLRFIHVATKDPSQDVGTYLVKHGATSFPVSVASACSGVNGVVGYLLVAVAFITGVVGSALRKLLWLALGLVAVWMSNVARILVILMAGHRWGENVAIGILHPFIGLLMFNVVVLLMVLGMRRFGLALRSSRKVTGVDLAMPMRRAVPKIRLAAAVVAVFAVLAAIANSSLRSYDLVVSSLGAPRLVPFTDSPAQPPGWTAHETDVYTWAKPFFGENSTWYRFMYVWDSNSHDQLQSSAPVISDVIQTSDLSSFSTYGIEACYRFHGYKLHSIKTVDLGGGVTGNVLAYYNSKVHSDWTTVYWHWPVKTAAGKTRYERVTVMMINSAGATFSGTLPSPGLVRGLGLGVDNVLGGHVTSKVDAQLNSTRLFLVAFARSIISRQAVAKTTTTAAH
jgi:exosortase/archaeosortase family protein